MKENFVITSAEYDEDYGGIMVNVKIDGIDHQFGEQLIEETGYGCRRACFGDDDAGSCWIFVDGEDNPDLTDEQQKIFDRVIDAGMEMLGEDQE